MLTSILRVFLTRSFRPFIFKGGYKSLSGLDIKNLGLYIHVPFCRKLCSFCPYYKVEYDRELIEKYIENLLTEIRLIKKNCNGKRNLASIYFGGGSPALAAEFLPDIISEIKKEFDIEGNIGIELHPGDINFKLVRSLKGTGFDMVSIGVQSFKGKCLLALGRDCIDSRKKIRIAASAGFEVIDVDLLFGIPDQTPEDLAGDFKTAVKCGATQISTYPFIEFSYSGIQEKPLGRGIQEKMLELLIDIGNNTGFKRASVWTFTKNSTQKYSSVTRDNYIGLGPGAATLTRDMFKINTFSVDEYNKCLLDNKLPTALTLRFDNRRRALYWLFWSAYNLQINRKSFRELFGLEFESFFRFEILLGKMLGLIKENRKGYKITERGARLYHIIEQVYTHQYIDKTWRTSMEDPWPEKLVLH